MRGLELCVDWSCAWRTTPVAKPDWIEEPSVTTATVTMSRSLRALGGSIAASRRGVVLVVCAESVTSITRGLRTARPLGEREGEIQELKRYPSTCTLTTPVSAKAAAVKALAISRIASCQHGAKSCCECRATTSA